MGRLSPRLIQLLLAAATVQLSPAQLAATVAADASYTLSLDGVPWLASAPVAFAARWAGVTRTSANGLLTLDNITAIGGTDDILGAFAGWEMSWSTRTFVTRVKNYAAAVVFEQEFPTALAGMAQNESANPELDLSTAFPAFGPPHAELDTSLSYLTWHDTMCTASAGQWTSIGAPAQFFADVGGAVVLYNASLSAVVISAASNFMVAGIAFPNMTNTSFAAGFGGYLNGIPAGTKHTTILVGGVGVNATMYEWGSTLLALGGKARPPRAADVALASLGYWTDRGGYYYYNSAPFDNYQSAILAAIDYETGVAELPITYVQFDSWWYYKEAGETPAMTLWEPQPEVFPSGMNPEWIRHLPLVLHSRMFARENNYSNEYTFLLTDDGVDMALPIDQRLFAHIMGKAAAWGMRVYEQDWLVTVYQGLPALTKGNLTAAHDWLTAMAAAATELNITIQ